MEIYTQIIYLLSWLILLKGLQLSLWPYLKPYLEEYSYPVAYPASILLFTLISWYCGLLQIPLQAAIIPFILLLLYSIWKRKFKFGEMRNFAFWDFTFLIFFAFVLEMRFINPVLTHYGEGFMDHGFIASIMRSPIVPPLDPWASGLHLTMYYYLGHWMLAALALISGIPSYVVWNLALPTVCGISAVMLLAIGQLIIPRLKWLPLLLLLLINPAFIYHVLKGESLYFILDGSRWVVGVPTEYPLFSMILGDAHGHVLGIFNQFFLLFLLGYLFCKWDGLEKGAKVLTSLLCVLSLGAMGLISTWDIIVYGPLTILAGLLIAYREKIKGFHYKKIVFIFILILILAIILYLPFYIQMNGETVKRIVPTKITSNPFDFFLYSGFFLVVLYYSIHKTLIKKPLWLILVIPFFAMGYYSTGIALIPLIYIILKQRFRFVDLLAVTGLAILIFCELFTFIQGNDLDYYRFITIFKLYYIAWVLLCIPSLVFLGELIIPLLNRFTIKKRTEFACFTLVVIILLAIPLIFQFDMGKGLQKISFPSGYYTLDSLAYMKSTHPDDFKAISFLRNLSGDERLVEATGQDWSYFSRISSFTGIPTILGEPNHELSWRGYRTYKFWDRDKEIPLIYEEPDLSITLLKKYNTTLIYTGDLERKKYKLNLPKKGIFPVFVSGNVTIYRVIYD